MRYPVLTRSAILLVATILLASFPVFAQQIDSLGGPYTPDSHTVLLLHFDSTWTNASSLAPNATTHGVMGFSPTSARPGLGDAAYFQNDAISDSSYLTVPNAPALNMSGNWTIEGWFDLLSFGTSNTDWRFVPAIMWKAGDVTFDQGNYFAEIWGNVQSLHTGFSVANQGWPDVESPANSIQPNNWYHFTFIRDTTHHVEIQMINDQNLKLVWFGTSVYDPVLQAQPNITTRPLYLGTNGETSSVQPGFFDGFMDEIRISNVVRNFAVPPVVLSLSQVPNQIAAATAYPAVRANVVQVGGSPVTTVTLHYNAGSGWQTLPMSIASGDSEYSATIPSQSQYTIVNYYISATNSVGQRDVYPLGAEDATNPQYMNFAVSVPNTETLNLTFENGSGVPVDSSAYKNTVQVVGSPYYSDTAAVGSHSLYFNGINDELLVPSPVLSDSTDFTLDFWMDPDTLYQNWQYIINKPALTPDMWGQVNYAVISGANSAPGVLTAWVWSQSGGDVSVTLPDTLTMHQWYHVLLEVKTAPAGDVYNYYLLFQLRDKNNNVIATGYKGFMDAPTQSPYALEIGRAGGNNVAYYQGRLDNIRFYNYVAVPLQVNAPPNIFSVNQLPNLVSTGANSQVAAGITAGLGTPVDSVALHYNAGNGWQTVAMTEATGDTLYRASIPVQPQYTVVYYYVSATNSDTLRALYPNLAEAAQNPEYMSFAVEAPSSQTLDLNFTDGQGAPKDHSKYNNLVQEFGSPTYTTDGPTGHAMSFNGSTDLLDVYSPVVGSSQAFTLDFWMEPDSLTTFWQYLIAKPALTPPMWGQNTYAVISDAFNDPARKLTAWCWSPTGGDTYVTLPVSLNLGSWYHVILEVKPAAVGDTSANKYYLSFQLRDSSDNVLATSAVGFKDSLTYSRYPMEIGKAGGDRPYYEGQFADITFYNYAHANLPTAVNENRSSNTPRTFSLAQNYPNPFNPTTVIQYSVPRTGMVRLRVYNVLGQQVANLVSQVKSPGTYRINFNGASFASGVYFYQMVAGNYVITKKMLLLK